MVYLLLALVAAFAPANVKEVALKKNDKVWFQFEKMSQNKWQGTHSRGVIIYTVGEKTIQADKETPNQVIDRLSISEIKSFADLRKFPTSQDRGSLVWKFESNSKGFTYKMIDKKSGKATATYVAIW